MLLPSGETEVIIVDNHSTDQSREYLPAKFPNAFFVFNSENIGFSKANNLALRQARGEYILFLNPDTILSEKTLGDCLGFFASKTDAAAVGVRMIDGAGHFLKESKRGVPFPWVAFCRLSGLSTLFPHSKIFSSYYQGFLPEQQINEVEVLSGAFIFIRKKILDELGSFDERFFMYAEDIDLSYRILQAGYKNYYLPGAPIIHFKGESTRKDSRYIHLFYQAMVQFIHKHFGSGPFVSLLRAAIWTRSHLSSIDLLFAKKVKPARGDIKTYLRGDPVVVSMIENRVSMTGREIMQEKESAGEIIFCEGGNFSFEDIIREMQDIKTPVSIKIHGGNSSSIVGSDSKEFLGETIPL